MARRANGSPVRVGIRATARGWRQLCANRGAGAVARTVAALLWHRLVSADAAPLPSELWRAPGLLPAIRHPFDVAHGTDTGGLIWPERLVTGHRHDAWNTAYYAVAPSVFAQAADWLRKHAGANPARFTFIDLGCGKGRAAMLASEAGFARVAGVELSPALHTVAVANACRFAPQIIRPELLLADAADFPWPGQLDPPLSGDVLLFLYHPFARPVLRRVLGQVRRELARSGGPLGEVWLLYVNPELGQELARYRWIDKLGEKTVAIGEEDRLADRFGSTQETFAVYRCRRERRGTGN